MIGNMDKLLIVVVLGWLGAMLGSFAGAQVWRLRALQLREDKKQGEKINERELKRLQPLIRPIASDRSECLHCHHRLAWYDLLPIISWVSLLGKCRYCKKPIGGMEPLIEVSLAGVFIMSYLAWPLSLGTVPELLLFVLWLVACVLMAILFIYDAKWFLLPFQINIALIVVAAAFAALSIGLAGGVAFDGVITLAGSVLLMSGLYYIFSLFGWVGLGDSILGLGLGLMLGSWELAFLALFLANFIGIFMLIPLALRKKLHRQAHIPFGPFLILGTVIALLFGQDIIRMSLLWSDAVLNVLMV